MRIKYSVLLLLLTLASSVHGQYRQSEFGQNRVQRKKFDWHYYGTKDYDVHFYQQGEKYGQIALDELDKEYESISDMIGYSPFAKAQIFIYSNHGDLLQSNVGIGQPIFTLAGETKFVKLMTEISYTGSVEEFRKELRYKTTQMLMQDMMFGGSLGEVFQNSYLLHLPNWFVEGATRYVAYGWDSEMDDYVRDYLGYKKLKPFRKLEGEMAELVGHSVWNYIAIKYGRSNMSNILNLARVIRNEELAVASSLGISFEQFVFEWAEYYKISMESVNSAYIAPTDKEEIVKTFFKESQLTKIKLSPDGTKLAYVQNTEGKYKVVIKNLENGKENVVHRGGYTLIDQENSFKLPVIAWASDYQLGIIDQEEFGSLRLNTVNLNKGNKTTKSIRKFNTVNSLSYNDNGKLAVVSAETKGKTDLFLLSTRKNAIRRLTKDSWDEVDPVFIPNTNTIIFSSNRQTDSLRVHTDSVTASSGIMNLYTYSLDTTRNLVMPITNTLGVNTNPLAINQDFVYYLSDLRGINNLYKYNFQKETFDQVTNFRSSILDYDINPYTKDLVILMLKDGEHKIYLYRNYDIDQTVFPPASPRHQVKQVQLLRQRKENLQNKELLDKLAEAGKNAELDSIKNQEAFKQDFAESINLESTINELKADTTTADPDFININKYQFSITPKEAIENARGVPQDSTQQNNKAVEQPVQKEEFPQEEEIPDEEYEGFININNYRFNLNRPSFDFQQEEAVDPMEDYINSLDQEETDSTTVAQQISGDSTNLSPESFQFEEEIPDEAMEQFSFLDIYLKLQEEPEVVGPLPFVTSFSLDKIVTSTIFDQYRGFGILIETQLSDLLDNHQFTGGFMFTPDFQSGDFYSEYKYLKNPIDYRVRYDRRVIFREGNEPSTDSNFRFYSQKYKMNTYTLGASFPTSVASRFETDVFMSFTEGLNLHPEVLSGRYQNSDVYNGSSSSFGGYRFSWVYDRTVSSGLNLFEGSRGRLTYEEFRGFSDQSLGFRTLSADLRRYQKIHRELILAARVYYARSLGRNPRTYMLGGMDNWIGSRSDNTQNLDTPLSFSNHKDNTEVLFSEFVNLRGFDYNRFSGENVLAGSAELRWPIVKYFSSGAIRSDFMRNLMLIGFYDVGSSWSGPSPFEEGNTVDTRQVGSPESPFTAVVRSTRSPWLSSYGFGLRTALLGYYTRFDFAKPIEDYRIGNMRFYFTIGYDF